MKVLAVIGSRLFKDKELGYNVIDKIISENPTIDTIVSGGAKGADTIGEDYAKDHGLKFILHKVNWKDLETPPLKIMYNSSGAFNMFAGKLRNSLIVKDADIVVAFTNGSSGTKDSISKAKKKGIPVLVVPF